MRPGSWGKLFGKRARRPTTRHWPVPRSATPPGPMLPSSRQAARRRGTRSMSLMPRVCHGGGTRRAEGRDPRRQAADRGASRVGAHFRFARKFPCHGDQGFPDRASCPGPVAGPNEEPDTSLPAVAGLSYARATERWQCVPVTWHQRDPMRRPVLQRLGQWDKAPPLRGRPSCRPRASPSSHLKWSWSDRASPGRLTPWRYGPVRWRAAHDQGRGHGSTAPARRARGIHRSAGSRADPAGRRSMTMGNRGFDFHKTVMERG